MRGRYPPLAQRGIAGRGASDSVHAVRTAFTLLKRHWVGERTLAWLMNFRRHARDYEELTRHSEALIQIAMIH